MAAVNEPQPDRYKQFHNEYVAIFTSMKGLTPIQISNTKEINRRVSKIYIDFAKDLGSNLKFIKCYNVLANKCGQLLLMMPPVDPLNPEAIIDN